MPRTTETFRVFISSPSDLGHERGIVKAAVISASRVLSARNISLEPWLWEEDTTSEFNGNPQEVISSQLGEYDFYIGLMGSSFGSPTLKFGSGTEEEFHDAMVAFEAGKLRRVGFFFKEVLVDISKLNSTSIAQIQKISEFRDATGKLGLYKLFATDQKLTEIATEYLLRSFDDYHGPGTSAANGSPIGDDQVASTRSPIFSTFARDVLSALDKEITGGETGVSLDDLWVDLDLRGSVISKNGSIVTRVYDVEAIAKEAVAGHSLHISGRDASGKTAVCTRLFLSLYDKGFYPVLLSGKEIKFSDRNRFLNRVRSRISEQYEGISQSQSKFLEHDQIIVLLDDFDLIPLNTKLMLDVAAYCKETFHSLVIATSISFTFSVIEQSDEVRILGQLIKAEIQDLGQKKRYDLVEKWYHLKSNYGNESSLRHKIELARSEINRILITHIVPRTPVIVLILLQALDNNQMSDLAQSGYVRYYKFLIDNAILRNLRIDEAELAYALLPELAWATYNTESKELSSTEAEHVVEDFSTKRALRKPALYSTLERLRDIGMFDRVETSYRFKHPYAYNFFLAEYLSNNLASQRITELVQNLCVGSWSKDHATILVFLSFHSNSPLITNSLITQLNSLYKEAPELDFLGGNTEAINKLITVVPKQIVDQSRTKESRDSRLKAQDTADMSATKKEEADQGSPLSDMESVFMAVEVLGHIMRNHYARLDAEPKREMFEAVTSAVLRCAGGFISLLSHNIEVLVSYTAAALANVTDDQDVEGLEAFTRSLVFLLAVGFVYHCCKKLAVAVGDENLEITYHQSVRFNSSVSRKFLDAIIKLDCFQKFPAQDLTKLVALLDGNHVANATLRAAVSERLDMRPPNNRSDFQKYCQIVGLEPIPRLIERQRLGSKSDLNQKP